jgi:hypothetical protein
MSRSYINPVTRQTASARIAALFPRSYEGSRARFRQNLDRVRQFWPEAHLVTHRISSAEGLTIDWIEASPQVSCERLLILTTGEHGIEAYVGSAVMQVLIDEFLHRLHTPTTGLVLVHAINPWGMKYRRRVNSQNVDLNRNFYWNEVEPGKEESFNPAYNPYYDCLSPLLNPQKLVRHRLISQAGFIYRLIRSLARDGASVVRNYSIIGQYHEPRGIYYGGSQLQEETQVLIDLFRRQIQPYRQILLLDMHTGYGPRYQMRLVNSSIEPRDSAMLAAEFHYPLVLKANKEEFYDIQGDMIDYLYRLVFEEYPDTGLYATTFEFGTFGNSWLATLRDLSITILENQLYWYGSRSDKARLWIKREFEQLYFPSEAKWRAKAIIDARRAFEGVLRAEGFFYLT